MPHRAGSRVPDPLKLAQNCCHWRQLGRVDGKWAQRIESVATRNESYFYRRLSFAHFCQNQLVLHLGENVVVFPVRPSLRESFSDLATYHLLSLLINTNRISMGMKLRKCESKCIPPSFSHQLISFIRSQVSPFHSICSIESTRRPGDCDRDG